MTYLVTFVAAAQADLSALDSATAKRVIDRIFRLARQVEYADHEALAGPLHGQFKLRAGDYRVTYTLDRRGTTVLVHGVGHRSRIYEED